MRRASAGMSEGSFARLGAVLIALFFWPLSASAITIAPVLVEISPARRVVSITITNPGDTAIRFQTTVRAWTQRNGTDQYEPSDEIVVVPPIAEIPAAARQIFRVTTRRPFDAAVERAYRLVFEDVTPVRTGPAASDQMSVTMRVNHDLPVFVSVRSPQLRARLAPCSAPAGPACVRIENQGNRYLAIRQLTLATATWQSTTKVNGRVLAGAWRQFQLQLPDDVEGSLHVAAELGDGTISAEWPIAK